MGSRVSQLLYGQNRMRDPRLAEAAHTLRLMFGNSMDDISSTSHCFSRIRMNIKILVTSSPVLTELQSWKSSIGSTVSGNNPSCPRLFQNDRTARTCSRAKGVLWHTTDVSLGLKLGIRKARPAEWLAWTAWLLLVTSPCQKERHRPAGHGLPRASDLTAVAKYPLTEANHR